MYRCRHFGIRELVTPGIYQARGDRAWELLQPGALLTLDALRDRFGETEVNNWEWGGSRDEAGLREWNTRTGATYSMHKYGGAFDPRFRFVQPPEVAEYVLAHPDEFPYITAIEDVGSTPTWFHFDGRNHSRGGIWIVKPTPKHSGEALT